jgi:hypothetical protein
MKLDPLSRPALRLLHGEDAFILSKLAQLEQCSTETLLQSLAPGRRDCLKVRPDGTIIDGNHRIHILRKHEVDVDALPREIILKEEAMWTQIHWVDGPWPGRLGLAARPRGGEGLRDELVGWRGKGVDELVSLLTRNEELDLELAKEADEAKRQGMEFVSFPIPDRQVPDSPTSLAGLVDRINADLAAGRNVLIHCRQGIGRSGLVAACLLVSKGWDPNSAIKHIRSSRGIGIPDTAEQRQWIHRYAAVLAGAK